MLEQDIDEEGIGGDIDMMTMFWIICVILLRSKEMINLLILKYKFYSLCLDMSCSEFEQLLGHHHAVPRMLASDPSLGFNILRDVSEHNQDVLD